MIYPRRDCITCGTRFTPNNEQQVDCGECHIWQGELDDWGTPAPRERASRPYNPDRSLENYRRGARRKPKT